MQTSQLLKKEINQTVESLHDFAKWKLIVTAAIAAAALGLTSSASRPLYWLLLFIPFTCAYIDLNCYQYQIRITVISRFLRQLAQDPILEDYERMCEDLRAQDDVFDLGKYAQVGASLFISIIAGLFPIWQFAKSRQTISLFISVGVLIFGVLLICWLWKHYDAKNKAVYKPLPPAADAKSKAGEAKAAGN